MRNGPQPSIRAASSRVVGIVRMNWTSRNTKNVSTARYFGARIGSPVPTQPNRRNRMYCGTIVAWNGSMIVSSMIANSTLLKGKRSRAKANAARLHDTTFPTTASEQSASEFTKKLPNGARRPVQPRR
jgi:hypothetical protein